MHDTSARLVERVLPAASYRQLVLTVPFPLRLRIARDPGELSRVLNLFHPDNLRAENHLPTQADGAARSEFERAARSGTLRAPPTTTPPKQPKQHWDFHQTRDNLLVSGIRIDLLAPSLVVCADAAKAKGRILRSVLSRHYTGKSAPESISR
jgi:hypothetical protein